MIGLVWLFSLLALPQILLYICCGLQIRPVEEQFKQRVIGKHYCISRKRKSYKGSTRRAQLVVHLSNVS